MDNSLENSPAWYVFGIHLKLMKRISMGLIGKDRHQVINLREYSQHRTENQRVNFLFQKILRMNFSLIFCPINTIIDRHLPTCAQ